MAMKIKYSPIKSDNVDTVIEPIDENTVKIDDEQYEFDFDSVLWPDIQEQTKGAINSAYRANGELYLEIRRYYTYSCSLWDTGDYHDIVW